MDKITTSDTTAEALAVVREAMEGEWFSEEVDAALVLIEKRMRMMQAQALRADEWQDAAEKAEVERDEARRRFSLEELERLERRVAELEAALREILMTDGLGGASEVMRDIARRALQSKERNG